MTAARNIHLAALAAEPDAPRAETRAQETAPRLRAVTNDPAREYAQRPGEVERLPDNVAALILCKVGRALVERHQIKVKLEKRELVFSSPHSVVITEKNGTGQRVLWALNRRAPELLHLLNEDGSYIETLPLKGEAQWFGDDEASQKAMAAAKSHMARDMARLAYLHQPDTAAAAAAAQHNAAEVARLVQTFPAADATAPSRVPAASTPAGHRAASIAPEHARGGETLARPASDFPKAARFEREAGRHEQRRSEHQRRVVTDEHRHASAVRLGAVTRRAEPLNTEHEPAIARTETWEAQPCSVAPQPQEETW